MIVDLQMDGSFYIKGLEKRFKFFYGFHLHKMISLFRILNNLKIPNNNMQRELSVPITSNKETMNK